MVPSDDKRRARLNVIHHILRTVPYEAMPKEKFEFPERRKRDGYRAPSYPYEFVEPAF